MATSSSAESNAPGSEGVSPLQIGSSSSMTLRPQQSSDTNSEPSIAPPIAAPRERRDHQLKRADQEDRTTTTTTTTSKDETMPSGKPSAVSSKSLAEAAIAQEPQSEPALESSASPTDPSGTSSKSTPVPQRTVESRKPTRATTARNLPNSEPQDLYSEQRRLSRDDMVTSELQYPPIESSPPKHAAVTESTTAGKHRSAASAQEQAFRTIRKDGKTTIKPVFEWTSEDSFGIGSSRLSPEVKMDSSGGSPIGLADTSAEQAECFSDQRSRTHTPDKRLPLMKPRPPDNSRTPTACKTAPLIKPTRRRNRPKKFRRAATRAQSRSPIDLTLFGGVEEQELRRGWVRKKAGTVSSLPQASRSSCHSSEIPGTREPEQTVVQSNEGAIVIAWGPLVFRERLLYPLALSLGLALVLVLTVLFYPHGAVSGGARTALEPPTCTSSSCLRNAMYLSELLSWDNVDPCDDFYAFVCRRWTSQYSSASTGYSVSSDDDYATYLEDRLYALLHNASHTSRILQPLQDLYEKCSEAKRTEDEGWNSLLELMFNVSLEGFPLTPPVRKSISVWKTAAMVLRKTGSSALLSAGIGSHPWLSKDVVTVGPPDLLTAKGGVDINEAVRLYTMASFTAIKALRKDFLPPSLALGVVKFATEIEMLAELTLEKSSPVPYVLGSVPEVFDFVAELLRGVNGAPSIEADSEVLICPVLVNKILEIVKSAETHTVMNYLGVRLMIEMSPFIPHSDLTVFYGALLYGRRRSPLPRWQLCIRVVEKALFPLVYISLFTDLKLHVSVRRFVDLTREIISEFTRGIDASAYFDNSSKTAVRNVLASTQVRVLGPDWVNEPDLIDAFADKAPAITGSRKPLESYVSTYEYTFVDAMRRGSAQRWSRPAFSTECWHEPSTRTIHVPLLLFNVTEAFDDTIDALQLSRAAPRLVRCIFDALLCVANSTNITEHWLSEDTRSRLQEIESCFDAHNAQSSLIRLRDTLAARIAYAHFRKIVKTSDRVLAVRMRGGILLTDRQVFFVNLMLQACESSGRLNTGAVALAGRDWTIALHNSKDFPNAFNCSVGTGMNPLRKCAF
ncbi:hypothetical protein V5799_025996 [Amblyomma americanum]|uniref:Peptidase M13 N-terminal domain-containing protein n=1 Tax=Amblyomma americanum TaxID=6943 RepID=A0AAQ4DJU3_AMBAM